MSTQLAQTFKIKQNDVVRVGSNDFSFEVPVVIQPGLVKNAVSIALGFGRRVSGKVGTGTGVDGLSNAVCYSSRLYTAFFFSVS
jgi:molybdopterin-containing oxidoreductase family iron-sulfur binding subunit